jgi:hypothetical protein
MNRDLSFPAPLRRAQIAANFLNSQEFMIRQTWPADVLPSVCSILLSEGSAGERQIIMNALIANLVEEVIAPLVNNTEIKELLN